MRKEHDFSQSRKNPYAKQLKRQITIRLDTVAVDYFKNMAAELGMPYRNLINLFLRLRHAQTASHHSMAGACGEAAGWEVTRTIRVTRAASTGNSARAYGSWRGMETSA
jgi:hypothetical protein